MKRHRWAPAVAFILATIALAGCASQEGSDTDVGTVVGTWQTSEDDGPYLTFAEDGKYSGNDGCNGFSGRYEQDGDTVTFRSFSSTARACVDVDTWLSKVSKVTVGESELTIYDKSGDLIGTLAKDS